MIKTIRAVLVLTSTAAATGWTIELPPPPDTLSPGKLRERAARLFPRWPRRHCRF